jgi:hypothetical protein
MPVSYRIEPAMHLVLSRARGRFTNAELRDFYHQLAADPRFRPEYCQLSNVDDVTEFELDSWMIAQVASWPIFDVGTRRAIVAAGDVGFGLARMFSSYGERVGQDVRVFRTEAEALAWLNSPVAPGFEPPIEPGIAQAPRIAHKSVA